jgi:hypothetical protein
MSIAEIELPLKNFEDIRKWSEEASKEGRRQWGNTDLEHLLKVNINENHRERILEQLRERTPHQKL